MEQWGKAKKVVPAVCWCGRADQCRWWRRRDGWHVRLGRTLWQRVLSCERGGEEDSGFRGCAGGKYICNEKLTTNALCC